MKDTRAPLVTVGSVLDGRFELLRCIGRGGFATVYEARQINIGRMVAVKVLTMNQELRDDQLQGFKERFFLEAQAAAGIHHPDIVTIHDYGVVEQQPYIVMEMFQGHDLGQEVALNGALDPKRAIPLFIRCLDALQAAHDQTIVHKDLKPSNLFLTDVGSMVETLRILDFGIAAVLDPETGNSGRMTATGEYVGTAMYCAPEYYDDGTVTPAVDVYQMGLILAEMLTGRAVVDDRPVRAIMRHLDGDVHCPPELQGSPIEPLITKALERNHRDRYQTAGEFRDALSTLDPATIPNLAGTGGSPTLAPTAATSDILVGRGSAPGRRHTPTGNSPMGATRPARPMALPPEATPGPAPGAKGSRSKGVPLGLAAVATLLILGAIVTFILVDPSGPDDPGTAAPAPAAAAPAVAAPSKPDPVVAKVAPVVTPDASPEPVVETPKAPPRYTVQFFVLASKKRAELKWIPGRKEAPPAGEEGRWTFDPATVPPPWDLQASRRGHKTIGLRVTPDEDGKHLQVSLGRANKGEWAWDDAHTKLTATVDGTFEFKTELERKAGRKRGNSFID